jgi:putative peptide zinc metalloprotease protein
MTTQDTRPPPPEPSAETAQAPAEPAPTTGAEGAPAPSSAQPQLASGVEFIGEYEGSGYKVPPLIVRRPDGQVVQLTELLYRIAQSCDGQRDVEQIAAEVGEQLGKGVSGENVRALIDEKIQPLGILKNADGSEPDVERVNPFLALKFRTALVPDRIVRALTTIFRPLYWPPVLLALVAAFAAFDLWLFFVHGIGSGLHQVMYEPVLLLVIFGLLVVATAFHEIGHATACRYGGAEPGKIGFGIYLVWPAFYTDVTDAYRLGRWSRIRVDLGGVYFNAIFILVEAALYWYTGYEPLLIAILVQHLEMVHQFLPFLRLDGYFVVSDLVGVPDLFTRMKPLLQSLIPGREPDASVKQLKPKVRFAVTAWVLLVIPILLFQLGMIVLHAPRIFGTGIDSLGNQYDRASDALREGAFVPLGASGVQILALALPMLGMAYMLLRITKQTGVGAWRSSEGRPALRTAYMTTGVALLAFIGWTWWPNGDYAPIRAEERWTLQTGIAAARHAATGRAGLVPADPRAAEDPFGAAPRTDTTDTLTPEDAFDPDADETPEPQDESDIDPETSADPFFDPSPRPRDRSPAPESAVSPTPAATASPAAATAAPTP